MERIGTAAVLVAGHPAALVTVTVNCAGSAVVANDTDGPFVAPVIDPLLIDHEY